MGRPARGSRRRIGRALESTALGAIALALVSVGAACFGPPGDDGLPEFREGALLTGRVVENVTACEVDAVCYLRIAFADTTVRAVYGTGERPAPPCEIAAGVSNLAFTLVPGDRIRADLRRCESEGWLYIQTLGS